VKPLVTFGDPEELAGAYLAGLGIASTVGTSFPTSTLATGVKHLQVELEAGGVADYPVTERAQVRVTCHMGPNQRGAVKDLASLAQGHLTRFASDEVSGVVPLIGRSDVITDPATKNLMVWFVVRVDLTATLLAS
jgi:hypothetical protein